MNLGTIITEIATVAQIATASPDSTSVEQKAKEYLETSKAKTEQVTVQEPEKINLEKTANPFNVSTETKILSGNDNVLNFQRTEIKNDNLVIKHDYNLNNDDVLMVQANLPRDIGVAGYNQGDWQNNNMFYLEGWKTLKLGGTDLMLLGGGGAGKDKETQAYALGKFSKENLFGVFAYFNNVSDFSNLDESTYGFLGYDFGKAYVGAGKASTELMGFLGLKDNPDLGGFVFGKYDRKTDGWMFVSQAAAQETDESFFSKGMFDFIGQYFAIPSFFPVNFTPQTTKGTYSVKVQGAGVPGRSELEGKVGWNNNILPVSAGVNALSTKNPGEQRRTEYGPVIEVYKPIQLGNNRTLQVEAKYNFRNNQFMTLLRIQ